MIGVVVTLLACLGLAACTVAEPPPASPAAETVAPLPPGAPDEDIDAGTYRVTGFTVPFEITVPEGWQSFDWGVLKVEDGEWGVFVNFLSPTSVPTDACRWMGKLVDVDPSPEAYVQAMAAQTSTETSAPEPVVMGEYSGFEFDYAVESGVDIPQCDAGRICLFADSGASQCTRVHEFMDSRETERAIDLNGQLAMLAVGQFRTVSPELAAEARAVFDSIEFVEPGD